MRGSVKFFNTSKGYGFITPEDGSDDVFVHITEINRSGLDTLAEGDKVEFETKDSDRKPSKGPVAFNIRVLR